MPKSEDHEKRLLLIQVAIVDLKQARDILRDVGCKYAADYVARALKSAEGAERHAIGLSVRDQYLNAKKDKEHA